MKLRFLLISTVLLIVILAVACGPSQEELDATATAEAASVFATQTAEAPTLTPTPTNTPVPTETPTPAPTNTPAATAEPEEPSAAESDAAIAAALPTLEDLPDGFQALPPGLIDSQVGEGTEESLGPTAMFMNLTTGEVVVALLSPLSNDLQRGIFEQQLANPEQLADNLGLGMQLGGAEDADVEFETLEVEGIGQEATGIRAQVGMAGAAFIYDVILFNNGDVGAVVGVMHADGIEPGVDVFDLAEMVDGRLQELAE